MPLSLTAPALPPISISAGFTITPSNQAQYNGRVLAVTTALTITIGIGLINGFSISVQPPAAGNVSIASSGGVLLNGATSTINVARSTNFLLPIVQVGADSYSVWQEQGGGSGTNLTVGTTTIASGTSTRILYDNAGVLGEYSISGTGTTVAMTNGPSFSAPILDTPASGTLTNCTGLPISTGVSGLGAGVATLLGGASSGTGGPAGTTSPTFTSLITLGTQQTTQGSLILSNTAAGAFPTTLKSSNSASAAWTLTLPMTAGSANQVLKTDGFGNTSWTAAGSGSPGGANTQVQFNNSGSFAGGAGLTTNGSNLAINGASLSGYAFGFQGIGIVDPNDSNSQLFVLGGTQGEINPGSSRLNQVISWGYNILPTQRLNAGDSALGLVVESFYQPAGTSSMEMYWQYYSTTNTIVRPMFVNIARATDVTALTFNSDNFSIVDRATAGQILGATLSNYHIYVNTQVDGQIAGVGGGDVSVTGLTAQNHVFSTGDVRVGVANFFYWNGSSQMSAPANGQILLQNAAATDFSALILGQNAPGGLRIKKNSTAFNFRLGDDSSDANVTTGQIFASGDIRIGTTHFLYWQSRTQYSSPADGQLLVQNAAGIDFDSIILGAADNTGNRIKKNGTAFNFRLGNDSADVAITAGAGTFSGLLSTSGAGITVGSGQVLKLGNAAVTGLTAGAFAALTNATIVIADNTGQAYRIPCMI